MTMVDAVTHRLDGLLLEFIQNKRTRGWVESRIESVPKSVDVEQDVPAAHLPQFRLGLGARCRFRQQHPAVGQVCASVLRDQVVVLA